MRIVVDLQRAQLALHRREPADPVLPWLQAVVRNRGPHQIVLAASDALPETLAPLRAAFASLSPHAVRAWSTVETAQGSTMPPAHGSGTHPSRRIDPMIREAFVASLRPDVVYAPAVETDDEAGSEAGIGVTMDGLGPGAPTVVALIPRAAGRGAQAMPAAEPAYAVPLLRRASLLHVFAPLTPEGVAAWLDLPVASIVDAGSALDGTDEEQNTAARRLVARLEDLHAASANASPAAPGAVPERPRLVYVSPLPPQRTGIADYSALLLPALARHYAIDVVVAQEAMDDPWIAEHCVQRSIEWLREHGPREDRILYHVGNSDFHRDMPALLERAPGTVVLHDFHLGHLQAFLEGGADDPAAWTRELYHAHGYRALRDRFAAQAAAVWTYPVNLSILQRARGVIVHSRHAMDLARRWYGGALPEDWQRVASLRRPPEVHDKAAARRALGIADDTFLVCSFGALGPSKLNHRLLEGWLQSALGGDVRCALRFVGACLDEDYGAVLRKAMRTHAGGERVSIAGWTDAPTFHRYLAAADAAVQVRTSSRGETSAAVLDCMAYGLPTIVNANGTFAEIAGDAVMMLQDEFSAGDLARALESLRDDAARRTALGAAARSLIEAEHDPAACADAYHRAIEGFRHRERTGYRALIERIAGDARDAVRSAGGEAIADAIGASLPPRRARHLLVDVSVTCREDLKTGIQRAVRALTMSLIEGAEPEPRIEPVYLTDASGRWHYRYARQWTSSLMQLPAGLLRDDPVELAPGDTLLVLDLTEGFVPEAERAGLYRDFANAGVRLVFVVYDLLPLQMPEMFPPGRREFGRWFDSVTRVADRLVCISRSVADDVARRAHDAESQRGRPLPVTWFHLGADVQSSAPSRGLPADAPARLARFATRRTFLMVGTIEPRKGYLQVLDAFTVLWQRGVDIDLVIVGNDGWRSVPPAMRRTIPAIVTRLREHAERGERLFWLQDASDEYLDRLFGACTCLIAASAGEGFGLPLVEAARHGLPIIARDIPVFREVAGDSARYFAGDEHAVLVDAIEAWLALYAAAAHPQSSNLPLLTWAQSARQLLAGIGEAPVLP